MNHQRLRPIVLATLMASASVAKSTELITFDDYVYGYNSNYSYYYYKESLTTFAGLDWINASALNPYNPASGAYMNSGAAIGMVSLPSLAINTSAGPLQFSSPVPFTLDSAYFVGVWNNDLAITVKGLKDGLIVHSRGFSVGTSESVLENFNWTNLDSVLISAAGGTNAGLGGNGAIFAFDNLILTMVPEPVSSSLMAAGLLVVGLDVFRRRTGVTKAGRMM